MDVDMQWGIAPQRMARAPLAEDSLLTWLLRLPIDVDPTETARIALAEAPLKPGKTPLQSRLRGFLVEPSQLPPGRHAADQRTRVS